MAMKIQKRKFMTSECGYRKMDSANLASPNHPSSTTINCNELVCCPWLSSLWRQLSQLNKKEKKNKIPKDVPKGHMVVYVGQNLKRFVIKISLLNHPLFRALLDEARDEYGFTTTTSKLCIPCDENMFLHVICCANSPQERWIHFCL